MENCQNTSLQIIQQLKQFFRIIISAHQVSIYGAMTAICEEFENHQDGSRERTWNELNHFHQKAK